MQITEELEEGIDWLDARKTLPCAGGAFRRAVSGENSPAGLGCSRKTDKIL